MIEKKTNEQITIGYLIPGYFDTNYAEQRLIIDKIKNIHYLGIPKETADIVCIGTKYEENIDQYRQLVEACYYPQLYHPDVDIIHTFNTVCHTDKLWCASFETCMPRGININDEKKYFFELMEYMKRDNCKVLYALCKNAYEIQRKFLSSVIPFDDVEVLMKKTKVLHPPQKILISEEEFIKKHSKNQIHFIFIGRLFFIKGGREVIQVLSEFKNQYDFKLTLISSLTYNDYFTKTSYEEMVRCKKMIQEKNWITYYESLPNEIVLEKCKEATVGLLPSVAETYGYSVLEMQAAGCPVITTNIRAFPEINNIKCGWICDVPINEWRFCIEKIQNVGQLSYKKN